MSAPPQSFRTTNATFPRGGEDTIVRPSERDDGESGKKGFLASMRSLLRLPRTIYEACGHINAAIDGHIDKAKGK